MYQIGALAALEDVVEGLQANLFDLYVGASTGASVASVLAGGAPVQRIYRASLDPADVYFPLERQHIFRMDLAEWRRTVVTGLGAARRAARSLLSRTREPSPAVLWEEFDRLNDSLPAGVFTLEAYERFLEEFFARRGISNTFPGMPRKLRVVAHDLDSGEQVVFGDSGFEHVPVTRACAASMAFPPVFSPVRIGSRHYIDAGAAQVSHLDVAVAEGVDVMLVINPLVPVRVESVPTGHGRRDSVRDKGAIWVMSQASRIAMHRLMREACGRIGERCALILLEPDPTDGILFMYSPGSFGARRNILEYAYRTTRARVAEWLETGDGALERAGWQLRASTTMRPPA
jgi:predicted acylesterase/phospholipase RssA